MARAIPEAVSGNVDDSGGAAGRALNGGNGCSTISGRVPVLPAGVVVGVVSVVVWAAD